jgi:ABC-type spermidine/putrescine transport system permease subunit II
MKPTLNALSTLIIIFTVGLGCAMQVLENRSLSK